jgi:hypothetical protein
MPAVPLHEGHEIDKSGKAAQNKRQSDVAFAAFALPVLFAIAHDQNAGTAGSCNSLSTISDAKMADR